MASVHRAGGRRFRRGLASVVPLLVVFAVGTTAAGCGSDSSGSGDRTAAAATGFPTTVPAGTTLRIGDQGSQLEAPLDLSGQSKDLPYKAEYSTFASGPLLLEAFRADAVDIGFVADTPPVIAAASGQDLAVVAAWQAPGDSLSLVTRPGVNINKLEDLKGKKVAFTVGSILQAFTLRALDQVGLKQSDIQQVNLLPTDIGTALARGDADVGVLAQPLTATYLEANPGARVLSKGSDIAPYVLYLITTQDVLKDSAKTAAIGDFVGRWVKAVSWRDSHQEEFIQKYYVEKLNTPEKIGKLMVEQSGTATFLPINETVIGGAQKLADLFVENKVIPRKVDMSEVFDARFNSAVQEAQQ